MKENLKILIHDEVQLLDWGESRAAGPWVKLRLNTPEQLEVFRGMDTAAGGKKAGHILNLTLCQGDIIADTQPATTASADKTSDGPYGKHAQALRQSSFFRSPDVWHAIGADDEFLEWCRHQRCAFYAAGNKPNSAITQCQGSTVPAHVRRVADGAGTGIKPPYSAIPCCDNHHKLQHQHGESYFGGKEVFDRLRIQALEEWCWQTLKATLGYEHWSQVPPGTLFAWAKEHGVERYLPKP